MSEARPGGARREAVRPSSSVVGLADERMTEGGGLASEVSVVRSATAVKPQSGKVETVAARVGGYHSCQRSLLLAQWLGAFYTLYVLPLLFVRPEFPLTPINASAKCGASPVEQSGFI